MKRIAVRIKTIALMLVLLVAPFCVLPAKGYADEALQIGIDGFRAEDGWLKIYVNQNQGNDFMVTPDYTEVVLGSNTLTTREIRKFAETDEAVTYLCVVDVSGSMSQDRIDMAGQVIKDLAEKKKPQDKIAIVTMGNELNQSEYMTDSAQIKAMSDSVVVTHEDTNLYYAVVEEINSLMASDDSKGKRCLVIFSDGADDQATGVTRDEAEKAVTSSHIPVFTVGLLKNAKSSSDQEMAKILGSFARISSGGMHFAPALGDGSIETIADSVIARINSSFVLYEDLEDIKVSGKEVSLKTTVSTQYGQTSTDTITLFESDVKIIQEEIDKIIPPEPEPEPDPELEPEPEPEPEEKLILGLKPVYFYLICGILAILLILTIVFIIVKTQKDKKKSESEFLEEETEDEDDESEDEDDDSRHSAPSYKNENVTIPVEAANAHKASVTMPVLQDSSPSGQGMNVVLVRMGKGKEKTFKETVSSSPCNIGRNATQSKIAMSDDTALSGVHCALSCKGKRLFIEDKKSTNGTFVNGVPISGQFELNQDDIILIGSYEYRVSWK